MLITRFVFIFLLISSNLVSQNLKFKPLTTKDGLSNNSVSDIISDNDGRIWIATWDGLNIYNGNNITVFKHKIADTLSLSGNVVINFIKDKNGEIWIRTDNNSVSKYIGNGKFKNFHFKKQLNGLYLSKDSIPIVLLDSMYYTLSDKEQLALPKYSHTPLGNKKYEALKRNFLKKEPNIKINDILLDSKDNIWYATESNGLYFKSGTSNSNNLSFQHYTFDVYAPYSLSTNEIECVYEDAFGNIWLGYKDGGLSMVYNESQQITTILPHPTKQPNLPKGTIRAITKDDNQTLWLGYYSNGLVYRLNSENYFLPYKIKEANSNPDWNRIRSLYTASDGTIWVGSYAGIIKIGSKGYSLYDANLEENLPNNRNYNFYEDINNNIWITCWGGLAKYDTKKNSFIEFEHQDKLAKYHFRNVLINGDLIFLATEKNGLIIFNQINGNIEKIDASKGLSGNSVYHITRDSNSENYWISTLGGISIYHLDKGVFKTITEANNLPSHMVYSVLQSKDKFWASTTKGIVAINAGTYEIYKIPIDYGLQDNEFSEGAFYKAPEETLYYGGISGLNYFQPNSYVINNPTPNIKLLVDGQENFSKKLVKPHAKNEISVNIIPIDYGLSSKKIFYRLKGYNKEWMLYTNTSIKYENIPSGDYDFFVKIDEAILPSFFTLKIETPFYLAWWFYMFMGSLLIVVVVGIIKFNNRKSRLKEIILEKKIEERTSLINSQKNSLEETNASIEAKSNELIKLHSKIKNKDFELDKFKEFILIEFKKPLSRILSNVNQLKHQGSLNTNLQKEITNLINLISEWDYLDQVKKIGKPYLSKIDIEPFVNQLIVELHLDEIKDTEVKFEFKSNNEATIIEVDVLRLKLLFQYIFTDIIKYLTPKSSINISISLGTNTLLLSINSNCPILIEKWNSITLFSPYFKAFSILLNDLNGTCETNIATAFSLQTNIPITTSKELISSSISYMEHFDTASDEGVIKGNTILVFCKKEDNEIVGQLLNNSNYTLVFENTSKTVSSIVNKKEIHALIAYNRFFDTEITTFLKSTKTLKAPVVWVLEKVDVNLQERIIENGADLMIYMPVSPSFFQKQIKKIIAQYKAKNTYENHADGLQIANTILGSSPHEELVQNAIEVIKKELSNSNFNVDSLIKELDISRTKCYRVFKEVLDVSPSETIINLRLQKAALLLKSKRLNVSEVSYECGFNDPKYFSRLFKKYYKTSPKSYK
ncbi:two-component regulator propeller domain-containing protein [Galbibacter orientalis]|uniref:two-component regulator propeller domain-containing protein n=1 Tax=Galbibacter orientalis TaxID=453852 RepID=UPI00307FD85C